MGQITEEIYATVNNPVRGRWMVYANGDRTAATTMQTRTERKLLTLQQHLFGKQAVLAAAERHCTDSDLNLIKAVLHRANAQEIQPHKELQVSLLEAAVAMLLTCASQTWVVESPATYPPGWPMTPRILGKYNG